MSTPAYFFGQLAVKDFDDYIAQYAMPFLEVLPKFEGEVLAATPAAETLEGVATGNWTVLIKFPSAALARAFYASAEYAPLLGLRLTQLTDGGTLHLFEGTPPA